MEIGPGRGALTWLLLAELGEMSAVELDRDLVVYLNEEAPKHGKLKLYSEDVLNFDFNQLVQAERKLRVVGNLPYNISTPLIFHLLDQLELIEDMYFMLQNEVVKRLAADPSCKARGRLSVMVQARCTVEKVLDVPPDCFDPQPKVDSAIVRLVPHGETQLSEDGWQQLERVVTQAFANRRKTLRNNLKELCSEQLLIDLAIDPSARAETLEVTDFVRLAAQLSLQAESE